MKLIKNNSIKHNTMKNNLFKQVLTLSLTLSLLFLTQCKKNDGNNLPNVKTNTIIQFGDTYALGSGTVLSQGADSIYARGFCWGPNHSPTLSDSTVEKDTRAIGDFSYELDRLFPNTTYYVRAYAISNAGIAYGNEVSFTTLPLCAYASASAITSTTLTSASVSATTTNSTGSDITDKGFCWSTNPYPTLNDYKIPLGPGAGDITTNITGLAENSVYYVRAYTTNSTGTGYGTIAAFCTDFKDIDQNVYKAVVIGDQIWMAKNLNVTHYRNGDTIPEIKDNLAWSMARSGAYCNYNNDTTLAQTYGRLYNGYAVNDNRNIAPQGWHVPMLDEVNTMAKYLGTDAVKKLMETGPVHWGSGNDATNSSGFTALPAGERFGAFDSLNSWAYWWTSSYEFYGIGNKILSIASTSTYLGCSVRCIRDK
jgi:uncharacterized protein (TIGR02145 family)